jgi:NADH-quinone oxidoreductase subunit I
MQAVSEQQPARGVGPGSGRDLASGGDPGSGGGRGSDPGTRSGAGGGLLRGLATTAKALMHPAHTREYPDVSPPLPPRSRGVIALLAENCTVCMLCARECPDWCIYIDSHKETLPAVEGGRERQRNVLDRFAIDFSLCMYCGICIEVCPFDALFWSPEFEYAELDIHDLLHEKERLAEWMGSVPPPPQPDPAAPEPKEVAAARAPRKAPAARAPRKAAPAAAAREAPTARAAEPPSEPAP